MTLQILVTLLLLVAVIRAEVLLQDVRWSKQYNEIVDDDFLGSVQFNQRPCGTNNDGVCLPRGTCNGRGGYGSGQCLDGFGDCCHFNEHCFYNKTRVDVSQLVTNLDVFTPCRYRFYKEPGICQVQLRFDPFFHSRSANDDGVCTDDKVTIYNSVTVEDGFTTCGDLSGQHMHLTFGNRDFIDVSVHVNSYFNQIIATQIPCKSKLRAPDHCLQYFTQPNGMVKSFDFGGQQQSNQKYSVCVKPTDESKTITWKACSEMQDSEAFNIVSNYDNDILSCDTDWVQVRGSEKRCDRFLPLTSSWKAYDLLVNFDSKEMPEPFPIYNRPVDSNNHCIPENCEFLSIPGVYDCVCVGEHSCQCQLATTIPVQPPDLENRGFCLAYEQLGCKPLYKNATQIAG